MSITQVAGSWPILVLVFGLGISFGSFINVFSDRLINGQSLLGRSVCDHCAKQLAWLDLIPVLSFFLLKGKCRFCQHKISRQYPLIELITGLVFVYYTGKHWLIGREELNWQFFINLLIIVLLLTAALVDYQKQLLPDQLLILIFCLLCLFFPQRILLNWWGAGLAALFFGIIYYLSRGRAMGFGDVKLVLVLGFLISPFLYWQVLYLAFLTGAMLSVILLLKKKATLKTAIAFGPFIIIAFLLFF